jgi:lysozyme
MTIYFPDVSSAQAGVSFKGALVAVVKATEGTGYVNPDYTAAKNRAASAGSYFMAYHFLHQGNGAAQARFAFNVVGKTVPLLLDFEPYTKISSYPVMGDAQAFVAAYRKLGGTVHFVYMPEWYWQQLDTPSLNPLAALGMQLWSSNYAGYTDDASGIGWQPYGGMSPAVWQYTDSLSFNGVPVDFSAFRGHYAGLQNDASVSLCLAEFKSLATTGAYTHTPVVVPPANWAFGPVRNLVAKGGYTSVAISVTSPAAVMPAGISYYSVTILDNHGTVLSSYPRQLAKSNISSTQTAQYGGLAENSSYTLRLKACGLGATHCGAYTDVKFSTGSAPKAAGTATRKPRKQEAKK